MPSPYEVWAPILKGPSPALRPCGASFRYLSDARNRTAMTRISNLLLSKTPHWLVDRAFNAAVGSEPILFVSGFWRSGTTWIQEHLAATLQAKTVFEPLSTAIAPWNDILKREGITNANLREALIPGVALPGSPIWVHFDRTVSGATSCTSSTRARRSLGESLKKKTIVKDVRMQLNLSAIHLRYSIPIVHIRRHPCAVVSSLLDAPSNSWKLDFSNIRLAHLFREQMGPRELVSGITINHVDFDDDALSRIACYWALTEKWIDDTLSGKPWARIIDYERMVSNPLAISELCASIALQPVRSVSLDVDSSTTFKSVRGTPTRNRISAWRKRMSTKDIERVLNIVSFIHPNIQNLQ